jgi:hypothetical protein
MHWPSDRGMMISTSVIDEQDMDGVSMLPMIQNRSDDKLRRMSDTNGISLI